MNQQLIIQNERQLKKRQIARKNKWRRIQSCVNLSLRCTSQNQVQKKIKCQKKVISKYILKTANKKENLVRCHNIHSRLNFFHQSTDQKTNKKERKLKPKKKTKTIKTEQKTNKEADKATLISIPDPPIPRPRIPIPNPAHFLKLTPEMWRK